MENKKLLADIAEFQAMLTAKILNEMSIIETAAINPLGFSTFCKYEFDRFMKYEHEVDFNVQLEEKYNGITVTYEFVSESDGSPIFASSHFFEFE